MTEQTAAPDPRWARFQWEQRRRQDSARREEFLNQVFTDLNAAVVASGVAAPLSQEQVLRYIKSMLHSHDWTATESSLDTLRCGLLEGAVSIRNAQDASTLTLFLGQQCESVFSSEDVQHFVTTGEFFDVFAAAFTSYALTMNTASHVESQGMMTEKVRRLRALDIDHGDDTATMVPLEIRMQLSGFYEDDYTGTSGNVSA